MAAAATAPISGSVNARIPASVLLLFSIKSVGLDKAGNFARALPGNDGDPTTVPDRLKVGD